MIDTQSTYHNLRGEVLTVRGGGVRALCVREFEAIYDIASKSARNLTALHYTVLSLTVCAQYNELCDTLYQQSQHNELFSCAAVPPSHVPPSDVIPPLYVPRMHTHPHLHANWFVCLFAAPETYETLIKASANLLRVDGKQLLAQRTLALSHSHTRCTVRRSTVLSLAVCK